MARHLGRSTWGPTTDHRDEIAMLYLLCDEASDSEVAREFRLAAELLWAHDDTGISLDDWPTARQFVEHRLGCPVLPNLI